MVYEPSGQTTKIIKSNDYPPKINKCQKQTKLKWESQFKNIKPYQSRLGYRSHKPSEKGPSWSDSESSGGTG